MRRLLSTLILLLLAAAPANAAQHTVTAASDNTVFTPATLNVQMGDTVTFRMAASLFPHNVKFDDGSFEMPAEPTTAPWSNSRAFEAAGTFRYYCELHGGPGGSGMAGRIVVLAAGAPVPDTTRPVITAARPLATSFAATARKRVSFRLSEAATVRGVISRRVGRSLRTFGIVQRAARTGTNVLDVTRTRTGRALTPGSYTVTMTATDKAGNRSRSRRVSFRVRRPA